MLLLSESDRRKREQQLHDAEVLEDKSAHLADLLGGGEESDLDPPEKNPDTAADEIDG